MHLKVNSAHLFSSGCICKAYKYTAVECLVLIRVDPLSDKTHLQAIPYSAEAWIGLNEITGQIFSRDILSRDKVALFPLSAKAAV